MKRIAKLLLKNTSDNTFLVLNRTDHPKYGAEVDLPGGTHEQGEDIEETLVREMFEETGLKVAKEECTLLYRGTGYSPVGNEHNLYYAESGELPANIVLSWEHSQYRWLEPQQVVREAREAIDPFMHIVADKLSSASNKS